MIRKTVGFFTWMMFCFAIQSHATWFDTNFQYKQKITIQNGQVSGSQSNFPVLITQADLDTAFFDHVEKSTLSNMDIIFTNANEDAKLSREIVQFDAGGQELQAWVKTDLADATDTVIYMYYGYSGANEPNSTDTWSNSFAGVWHLESATGSANDVPDSSANANQGTSQNMTSSNVAAGQIGDALDFNGNDEYINCGNDSSLAITGSLTLSAWIRMDTTENTAMRIISKKEDSADTDGYGWARNRNAGDGGMYFYGVYPSGYATADLTTDTGWHHAAAVISGTTATFYIDGSAISMINSTVASLLTGTHDLFIANQDTGNTKCFDGIIDEARVVSTNRSSGWIATTYNNQSNPANFYNVGSEISVVADRYRSVGPGATSALATGSGNALTISGDTATFASTDLPAVVGVGDALQYDSDDGDLAVDAVAFIHARIDARTYEVRAANGAAPVAATGTTVWSIYRAYTSLANAEAGTENTSLDNVIENFDVGNRDLVTNEEIMHFACYANGTTADSGNITWDGWTTAADYYIHIYTPYASTEVGTSQRHSGIWNTSAYHITASNSTALTLSDGCIRLEGLQINADSTSANVQPLVYITGSTGTSTDIRVSHCILRGYASTAHDNHNGIYITVADSGTVYVWNNILYDFTDANNGHAIRLDDAGFTLYAYSNTIYNCAMGIRTGDDPCIAKNNIVQAASSNAYRDNFNAASDYNISNDGDAPGTTVKINTTVQFADASGGDFHLDDNDSEAKNWGANLSADANLPITIDIDNEARTVTWCAGADENDVLPGSPTFTPTVTATPSRTQTPTATPTATVTPSATVTLTPTESATLTPSPTITPTATITGTSTITPTVTPTPTITMTATVTPPYTHTATPTVTRTATHTPTATVTPTYTITRTATPSPSISPTPTITITRTITQTSTISPTSTRTPEYIVPNDLDRVVVYPNPYRADLNPRREVSFDRMPAQARIRLYDLSGHLVKTLDKDSNVPWIRWDLTNAGGAHIASGVYVYIITAKGQVRKGKLAILQ